MPRDDLDAADYSYFSASAMDYCISLLGPQWAPSLMWIASYVPADGHLYAGAAVTLVCLVAAVAICWRPAKPAPATATPAPTPAPVDVSVVLAPLAQIEHKVDQLAACLQAVTGVHVYYAAPGGMKLHASNGCTLLLHTKIVATLTVSPDVHAFLLRAQVTCTRCTHEATKGVASSE